MIAIKEKGAVTTLYTGIKIEHSQDGYTVKIYCGTAEETVLENSSRAEAIRTAILISEIIKGKSLETLEIIEQE